MQESDLQAVFTLILSDHFPHRASDINSLLVRTIFMIQMYCTSPKRKKYILWYYLHVASFFSIALLCLSLTSWYFIPSCLITALPFTKQNLFPSPHLPYMRTEHEPVCIFQPRSALHPAELERPLPHFFIFKSPKQSLGDLLFLLHFFSLLLLSLPNKVWETYCFCSVSYYYYYSSFSFSPFFPQTMNLSTADLRNYWTEFL